MQTVPVTPVPPWVALIEAHNIDPDAHDGIGIKFKKFSKWCVSKIGEIWGKVKTIPPGGDTLDSVAKRGAVTGKVLTARNVLVERERSGDKIITGGSVAVNRNAIVNAGIARIMIWEASSYCRFCSRRDRG